MEYHAFKGIHERLVADICKPLTEQEQTAASAALKQKDWQFKRELPYALLRLITRSLTCDGRLLEDRKLEGAFRFCHPELYPVLTELDEEGLTNGQGEEFIEAFEADFRCRNEQWLYNWLFMHKVHAHGNNQHSKARLIFPFVHPQLTRLAEHLTGYRPEDRIASVIDVHLGGSKNIGLETMFYAAYYLLVSSHSAPTVRHALEKLTVFRSNARHTWIGGFKTELRKAVPQLRMTANRVERNPERWYIPPDTYVQNLIRAMFQVWPDLTAEPFQPVRRAWEAYNTIGNEDTRRCLTVAVERYIQATTPGTAPIAWFVLTQLGLVKENS